MIHEFKNPVVIIADSIFILYFCEVVLGKVNIKLNRAITVFILFILNLGLYYATKNIENVFVVVLISIIAIFGMSYLFKGKISNHILVAIGVEAIITASDLCAAGLLAKVIPELDVSESCYYAGAIVSRLIALLYFIIFSLITKPQNRTGSAESKTVFFLCTIVSIVLVMVTAYTNFKYTEYFNGSYGLVGGMILIFNLVIYYSLDKITELSMLRERENELKNSLELSTNNFRQISNNYEQVRSYVHDTNKHLKTICEMIKKDEREEAVTYIEKTLEIINSKAVCNTGNVVIDALVSDLMDKCSRSGIVLYTDISVNNKLDIDKYRFSIILGNILDNAFNAALKNSREDERYIKVKISTEEYMLIIIVENIYEGMPNQIKKGYGIENTSNAVDELLGIYQTEIDEKKYKVVIMLPLN